MLSNTELTELKDLPKRIPKDAARYHFFLYKHTHEGDHLESIGKRLCSCCSHVMTYCTSGNHNTNLYIKKNINLFVFPSCDCIV